MYARSIEGMQRREKRVKRRFDVERGEGFFDRFIFSQKHEWI